MRFVEIVVASNTFSITVLVEVEYDYEAELQDELTIHTGDILTSVKQMSGGWWEGVLKGKKGLFPENFVKVSKRTENNWKEMPCAIIFTSFIKMRQ